MNKPIGDPKSYKGTSLQSVRDTMGLMLSEKLNSTQYLLSSLDPGAGKTSELCGFIQSWKEKHFTPSAGALIVLNTHKEIENCILRSGLEPPDFAVLIAKGAPLAAQWPSAPYEAPVLFTTHQMLRRQCQGQSFADTTCFHYLGKPRALRVWDEALLPAEPAQLRKDYLARPLSDLRSHDSAAANTLEALGDSLRAENIGQVVRVPAEAGKAHKALEPHLKGNDAKLLSDLPFFADREGVVVRCNAQGASLAGSVLPLPDDFAPCLILDASGRIRESYKMMEANGILQRLPSFTADYSRLNIHHWNRAASRSALMNDAARLEVLSSVAELISEGPGEESWLIIHPQDREGDPHSVTQELRAMVPNPSRLSFLHWGNHHGTNDYRHIRRVVVLGLWRKPQSHYSALHIAAGGSLDSATDGETLDAIRTGEHRHDLLQAICRASVREGDGSVCGDCTVYLVDRQKDAPSILQQTFPGASVKPWHPASAEMPEAALRCSLAIEECLREAGGRTVSKAAVRARLGVSRQAMCKTLATPALAAWMGRRGLAAIKRNFETVGAV
jgi:hypothetical protein